MDKCIRERAKLFSAKCDDLDFDMIGQSCPLEDERESLKKRDYAFLLSACGSMVCNQLNIGVGQAFCMGLLGVFLAGDNRHKNKQTVLCQYS